MAINDTSQQTLASSFGKIIDVIVDALGIIDFSYIVSGIASYIILLYTAKQMNYAFLNEFINNHFKLFLLLSIFFSYITGLISWIIGKYIRKFFRWIISKCKKETSDFEKVFKKYYNYISSQDDKFKLISDNNETNYIYMWKSLYKEDDISPVALEDIKRIRKYWVMQAVYKGLAGACIICILCTICLYCQNKTCILTSNIWASSVMFALLLCLFLVEAKNCAETQIKEVITSYYKYLE